jgi:Flp pilus assembly protein TadB
LQTFLSRVLARRSAAVDACPEGNCQLGATTPGSFARIESSGSDQRWRNLQQQLDQLRNQKQDCGNYLTWRELPEFESYARQQDIARVEKDAAARHAGLLERLESINGRHAGHALGTAVVGWLGLSGPAGWLVVAAASVGGWLVGRRMKRRFRGAGGRRRRRFRSRSAGQE